MSRKPTTLVSCDSCWRTALVQDEDQIPSRWKQEEGRDICSTCSCPAGQAYVGQSDWRSYL